MAALVAACSSGGSKPKPAELVSFSPRLEATEVWRLALGPATPTLAPLAVGERVAAASAAGKVWVVRASDGSVQWQGQAPAPLQAGVGFDGHMLAAVTERNELIAWVDGRIAWRQRLPAAVYTAPLVAGQRVFVLTAERVVLAFDGNTGIRLWQYSRPSEPLVLRQSGVLQPVGDTLLAGLGGRLVALNPTSGSVLWDVAVATPRGGNDIERLVDLIGPAARAGNVVCVRAFQASVGCVDAQRGTLLWRQASDGTTGLSTDGQSLFGTDAAGRVQAWALSDGQARWSQDALRFRGLSAPLWLGRSVALADAQGLLHLLSRDDGSFLARLAGDGTPPAGAPILAGQTLIVQTRGGQLLAWRPR